MKWKTLNPTQGTIAIPHQVRGIIVGIWGYAGVLPLKAFTGLFKGAGSARALQARAHWYIWGAVRGVSAVRSWS